MLIKEIFESKIKTLITSGFLICLLSIALNAQTPTPTPTQVTDDDIVKITTTLIQIDVTVTDKKGNIVTDLKPEEFEIYENKKKQEISNFSFIRTNSQFKPRSEIQSKEVKRSAIPIPPVPVRPEQVRRTIALVVDDLGLSSESIHFVRSSLKKFVDEQMQFGDLVAIIRTGGGIGATQQFTNNKQQLYAAINNIKWNSLGRGGANPFSTDDISDTESAKEAGLPVTDEQIEEERQTNLSADTFKEDIFSVGTLGAINFIVKGMDKLPGRKSVMLFSDGFRISPTASPGIESFRKSSPRDTGASAKLLQGLKNLTDLANRAAVLIYSFDARGLRADLGDPGTAEYNRKRNILYNNREGLKFLAKETGGQTFFDENDMNRGLDKALEDQKGFYLLGYQPDTDSFDPTTRRFNELEVKVNRPGLQVRYRSGFFGVADTQINPKTNNPAQQLLSAISSPFGVNDIKLQLNTVFGYNETEGSFLQSFVHIDGKELTFIEEADGWRKAVFEVLAISFGENGVPIDRLSRVQTLRLRGETYKKMIQEGFVYDFIFAVKKAGAYQMRIAIRDTSSAKIGSANQFIEVPNLKKNRLTLSGLLLENFTDQQWSKTQLEKQVDPTVDAKADTALRRFKKGTILRYGLNIYNAETDSSGKTKLQTQIKLFLDGKLILEGQPNSNIQESPTTTGTNFVGGLVLGDEMESGDYVLQIIVTDNLDQKKRNVASQWTQFEIID